MVRFPTPMGMKVEIKVSVYSTMRFIARGSARAR